MSDRKASRWTNSKRVVLLIGVTLAGLLFFPTQIIVVPPWTVEVVDETGKPVEGIRVRQVWKHYSIESDSHEETTVTGKDGKVSFPERRIRATAITRILGPVSNVLLAGVHASFGPSSWIIVFGKDGLEGFEKYIPGEPLPSRIVVYRMEERSGGISAPNISLGADVHRQRTG